MAKAERERARNPNAAAPRSNQNAAEYRRVYPISAAHPWRSSKQRSRHQLNCPQ